MALVSVLKHRFGLLGQAPMPHSELRNLQEIQKMKKSKLIDMFGLSEDSANNDRLDNLLFRLESDTSTASCGISDDSDALSLSITISTSGYESEDVFFKL
jgi:hypothetical protein